MNLPLFYLDIRLTFAVFDDIITLQKRIRGTVMNGEIEQMSKIVISARKALYDNKDIDFTAEKYILSVRFVFAPQFPFFKSVKANSVSEWFNVCKKRRLDDIKFLTPTKTPYIHLLGFANTSQSVIICYWENKKPTFFIPVWMYDEKENGWNVVYTERKNKCKRKKETAFPNQTEEFKSILKDIGSFASRIGFPAFTDIFNTASEALCSFSDTEDRTVPRQMPENFKGIYYAVSKADVFGAMGSWNDSPSYYAMQNGIESEYNDISARLLTQIRLNLMYVTNECWKKEQ